MRPIPPKLREEMSKDPFYFQCCITGQSKNSTKIDYHHNLIYSGRQVNEKFCILPVSELVHRNIVKHKEKLNWIMWNRATDEQIERYSKAIDYKREKDRLNSIYGQIKDTKSK